MAQKAFERRNTGRSWDKALCEEHGESQSACHRSPVNPNSRSQHEEKGERGCWVARAIGLRVRAGGGMKGGGDDDREGSGSGCVRVLSIGECIRNASRAGIRPAPVRGER